MPACKPARNFIVGMSDLPKLRKIIRLEWAQLQPFGIYSCGEHCKKPCESNAYFSNRYLKWKSESKTQRRSRDLRKPDLATRSRGETAGFKWLRVSRYSQTTITLPEAGCCHGNLLIWHHLTSMTPSHICDPLGAG